MRSRGRVGDDDDERGVRERGVDDGESEEVVVSSLRAVETTVMTVRSLCA